MEAERTDLETYLEGLNLTTADLTTKIDRLGKMSYNRRKKRPPYRAYFLATFLLPDGSFQTQDLRPGQLVEKELQRVARALNPEAYTVIHVDEWNFNGWNFLNFVVVGNSSQINTDLVKRFPESVRACLTLWIEEGKPPRRLVVNTMGTVPKVRPALNFEKTLDLVSFCTVFDESRENIIMVKESKDCKWFFPAGHLDANESFSAAGVRECVEESSLEPKLLRLNQLQVLSLNKYNGFHLVFSGIPLKGELKQIPDKESMGAEWKNVKQMLAELGDAQQSRKYRNPKEVFGILSSLPDHQETLTFTTL